jgi:tetratricopeptide (TPR) repeat protein
MIHRSPGRAILARLVLLAAVPLCFPNVAWADGKADCIAAFTQADALQRKGDYPGAAKAYERALELALQFVGPEHLGTASVLNNLAIVYQNMDQDAKAEPLYQRSLKIKESLLGADHPDVAQSLNNLGLLYAKMGQYAKAEPLYQRSLEIRESKLDPDHPDVAQSLNDLADLYRNLGQYAKAEPLFQRSLKIRQSKLGPNHPTTADSLNNLANLYRDMDQDAQAEWLYRRSLKIRESALGLDDPQLAKPLNNLALLYEKMGQYSRAEPLFQRSLKIRQSKLAPDDPTTGDSLNNLATLYDKMGQYSRAEPLYQQSLKIYSSRLGPQHPRVLWCLNNLGLLYDKMGQYSRAEPLFQQSLTMLESQLGPDHPDVAESLSNLASLYETMGQYAKAEPLFQRSLKIRESKLGPAHSDVAASLIGLANLYSDQDQYEKAEPLYQRNLKIWEAKLGPDHPYVAESLNNLAVLYERMRQYAKAEPLYQRSLQILESKRGPDHPYVAAGLNNLALLYARTGRWSDSAAEIERERRIVRRHVARTLPILSEKEQLTFLQTQDESRFHIALSLGLRQRNDAQISQRSAGWILNGKAVAQEVLAQRTLLATEAADPTLAELVKQLLAIRSRLASLSLTVPKAGKEADHRQQLETLSQQEQELSRQLGQATGHNTSGDSWVEPAAVRKALAKDAVLIEVARFRVDNFKALGKDNTWLPPRYAVWLIPAAGQGEIKVVDLGEAEKIEAAVQAARKALEKSDATIRKEGEAEAEKQLRDVMRDLARLVLEPLEEHLGQTRELVVSPDAALWLIPWGALPLADGKYAVEKYQIRYCISGRDLVGQAASSGRKATNPILFANPDYDLGPAQADAATRAVLRSASPVEQVASSRGLGSLSSLPRVGRLPGTAQEAAAIKPNVTRYAKAEAVVYEDRFALEGVFKALHGPQVLVLSTHGFFMSDQEAAQNHDDARNRGAALTTEGKPLENPLLRCGLLLAGCNQRGEEGIEASADDGVLTGLEIVGTDLRGTDLVVLSACETGLGQVRNGEGVAGLRQAFQLAGAKAVVATLWQIPDTQSARLMNAFFTSLAGGQSKADALRSAQRAMIQSRRDRYGAAHPFFWAAFTLTGE